MDMLNRMGQPLDPDGGVAELAAAGMVMGSHGRWQQQAARGLGDGTDACKGRGIPEASAGP
jgi:hypothetical protein